MTYSIARQRALASEKRRTWAQMQENTVRCCRCKQSKDHAQARYIDKPCGLKRELVCYGCVPEAGK